MIRQRHIIGCRCCDDRPRIRCPELCVYVGSNPDCPLGIQAYTVSIDDTSSPCWDLRPYSATAPRDNSNPGMCPGLTQDYVYLLAYAGGSTWSRIHGFGGVSISMDLDFTRDGPSRCQRYVKRFAISGPGRMWSYECRNGVAYISARCGSICFPWLIGGWTLPRIFPYPSGCNVTISATLAGLTGGGGGAGCFCDGLNRTWSLSRDAPSGNCTLDGNCVGGDWRSDDFIYDCTVEGFPVVHSFAKVSLRPMDSIGCGSVDLAPGAIARFRGGPENPPVSGAAIDGTPVCRDVTNWQGGSYLFSQVNNISCTGTPTVRVSW